MIRKITETEYVREYIPVGCWVLVEKDVLPKTTGGIYIPEKTKDEHVKYGMTGVIRGITPFTEHERSIDAYYASKLRVGDRVGFASTTPIISPAPPNYDFLDKDGKSSSNSHRFVTLAITDIMCVIVDGDVGRDGFLSRFKEESNG